MTSLEHFAVSRAIIVISAALGSQIAYRLLVLNWKNWQNNSAKLASANKGVESVARVGTAELSGAKWLAKWTYVENTHGTLASVVQVFLTLDYNQFYFMVSKVSSVVPKHKTNTSISQLLTLHFNSKRAPLFVSSQDTLRYFLLWLKKACGRQKKTQLNLHLRVLRKTTLATTTVKKIRKVLRSQLTFQVHFIHFGETFCVLFKIESHLGKTMTTERRRFGLVASKPRNLTRGEVISPAS